jgi:hypothetical protein
MSLVVALTATAEQDVPTPLTVEPSGCVATNEHVRTPVEKAVPVTTSGIVGDGTVPPAAIEAGAIAVMTG